MLTLRKIENIEGVEVMILGTIRKDDSPKKGKKEKKEKEGD